MQIKNMFIVDAELQKYYFQSKPENQLDILD